MADQDRDPTDPVPAAEPGPGESSTADDATQQEPTQPTPPTQEVPQPGYQQPGYQQPGYQQPGYQQPGYGPGYGYGTPPYQAPSYESPTYGTPPYDVPTSGTPAYEPGDYGAPGYPGGYSGQPGYGYVAPQTEPLAVWGLVVAIIAWVACPIPFVPAVVALALASNAQRNIDAAGGAKEGRGINTATKILAWINIGLWGLIAIFVVVAIVASGAANA